MNPQMFEAAISRRAAAIGNKLAVCQFKKECFFSRQATATVLHNYAMFSSQA